MPSKNHKGINIGSKSFAIVKVTTKITINRKLTFRLIFDLHFLHSTEENLEILNMFRKKNLLEHFGHFIQTPF